MGKDKPLHEKKVSELIETVDIESCGGIPIDGEIICPDDLKAWAIAMVKDYDKKSLKLKSDNRLDNLVFVGMRTLIEFIIKKFELTEEDLK